MYILLVHDSFDPAHLETVKAEMLVMGAPTIKAVKLDDNLYAALEGCHRLRAAHALGLTPEIEEIEYSEEVTTEDLGLDFGGDVWTVAALADSARQQQGLTFDAE